MNLTSTEMKSVTVKITTANAPTFKRVRRTMEVVQTEAAKVLGISQSSLSKIENTNPAVHIDGYFPITAMVRLFGEDATRAIMKAAH